MLAATKQERAAAEEEQAGLLREIQELQQEVGRLGRQHAEACLEVQESFKEQERVAAELEALYQVRSGLLCALACA